MSLDSLLPELDRLEAIIIDGIEDGMRKSEPLLISEARATTSYQDVTGATRTGTTAYLVTPTDNGEAALQAAVSAVEAKNPGHSQTETIGEIGQYERKLILTVPTDYIEDLETKLAGAKAFLEPTMAKLANTITQTTAQTVAERLQ